MAVKHCVELCRLVEFLYNLPETGNQSNEADVSITERKQINLNAVFMMDAEPVVECHLAVSYSSQGEK